MLQEIIDSEDIDEIHDIFERHLQEGIPMKKLKMNYVIDKINDLEARGCDWDKEGTKKLAVE